MAESNTENSYIRDLNTIAGGTPLERDQPAFEMPDGGEQWLDAVLGTPPVAGAEFAATVRRGMPPGWGRLALPERGIIGEPLLPHRRYSKQR